MSAQRKAPRSHSVHRGIIYWHVRVDAERIAAVLPAGARVVEYQRGYAVQRYAGGPYITASA